VFKQGLSELLAGLSRDYLYLDALDQHQMVEDVTRHLRHLLYQQYIFDYFFEKLNIHKVIFSNIVQTDLSYTPLYIFDQFSRFGLAVPEQQLQ
jgi:hypothetical protein